MPVISRVLRHLDIESDTFFELCDIDLHKVSPGTTRMVSPKDLIKSTWMLDSQQQDKLRQLAQRIDNLSGIAGQEILQNLDTHKVDFAGLRTPQDKLVRLYKGDRPIFRKAEAIFYVDEYREKSMVWSGYRLPAPVDLDRNCDLDELQRSLQTLFGNDAVVIEPYERYRNYKHGAPVRVLQFMVYREGVGVSIDVVNRERGEVESSVIYPARLYGIVYEPDTGVLEFYGKQQALRDKIRTTFCKDVLAVSDHMESLIFREVSLDILRTKQDLASLCSLKHGVREMVVKSFSLKIEPDEEPIIWGGKPRKPLASDVYNAMEKVDSLHILDRDNVTIHSATLVIHCNVVEDLPEDTITLTLSVPHTCDLPDNTLRNKYIIHELLVDLKLIKELVYG
ncbi:hypothetical protein [Parendozoicomonas sp. Alg238-R29]|uniref:hypothetical protein n=1 Tax=Parendozoicomonas sp. Alg238-R29 TaxID=2993446 RepID=UPI00248E2771|nr:hypothetical protein [Parendozoicomonas sp. Alg238-R29]